ncbi:MAG TPA: molybdopterin-dependent oxidoreductase [Pyrinomonadaceae bacterium]|nr:molybdopterin-dependent oxidoreductase [Pyrinomonadaceae bacterium]
MEPHFRTCNLCEAMCGIEITTQANGTLRIEGDRADVFSHGFICPKAVALQDIHYDKDRLKQPVRRTAAGWQQIGWNEAFDEVAENLKRVQAKHGRHSVATYVGNPTVHNYNALLFLPGFLRSLHTRNRFSATSVDQLAHHVAAYFMFGHQLLLPIPDLDRTDFLLIIGANPAASNGSLMTAPDAPGRLRAIRERGGKVILIDPRRNETASLADRHLFIRPGTDVLLLLALLHVIYAENRIRLAHLAAITDGQEIIAALVADFSPEAIAPITGIDAKQVRELARDFANAKTAVCYGRIGVSTQEFGGVCQWLINVLNIVTGNLDSTGGAMFTLPAFDAVAAPEGLAPRGSFGRWHSRVRKLPEFGGELPVAALAEEILEPGDGQIRAMITSAGNPVLSTPNGRQLDRAFAGLEFMASIDFYLNETTRHANIILPPTASLEHDHYDLVFHLLAIHNTAKYSPPLFTTNGHTRHDWQIFLELQMRMESNGPASSAFAKTKRAVIGRLFPPARILDLGLRFGPYGSKFNPFSGGLTLAKLKKSPHGVDLGPIKSCFPERLCTPNKRIALTPELLVKDIERVRARLMETTDHGPHDLLLIGRRQLRSNNSWMHNSERLVKGRDRCTLLMNPNDAAARNLTGGHVQVSSRTGCLEIPLEISADMMTGVISIPHGWGHNRSGIQMSVAKQHAGASINDLTDDQALDTLCGTAAFNGTWVSVTKCASERRVEGNQGETAGSRVGSY